MAVTVDKIEIIDNATGEVLKTVFNPVEGINSVTLSITESLKEIAIYAVAWLSTGWFSKASKVVKLIINAVAKYPLLTSYTPDRIDTDTHDLELSYNVIASFDVNNNFKFEVQHKTSSETEWTTVLDTPDKTDNDFSYTFTLDTTDQDIYNVRTRMQDVNGNYSAYSPIKEVVKGNILIADEQEAGTIVCFGHAVDAENQIYLII